jgi:hypothetical protein
MRKCLPRPGTSFTKPKPTPVRMHKDHERLLDENRKLKLLQKSLIEQNNQIKNEYTLNSNK